MALDELDRWASDFQDFHARFAPFFARSEPRETSRRYLRGLLARVARKNCWQMAEVVGDKDPDSLQRLLYSARWDEDGVRDELQRFVVEQLGDAAGIGVVDETGFVKKGSKSVGVKRQYTGTAGKIENCQVGVFLSYAAPGGRAFLDRRLYLPKEWCADEERRRGAQVPDEVTFKTKPELAVEMLEHAWRQGVPMAWVTGDEVYGDAPRVRDAIGRAGKRYVLGVSCHTPVWRDRPPLQGAVAGSRGRPRTKPRLAADAPSWQTVAAVITSQASGSWQRLTVREGEKGPITYDWTRQRIVESREKLPGPAGWLMARRSISDPMDIAYFLSNAPPNTSLQTMAEVASTRWSIETTIEEGKGETGLDEYEVRYWHSWYRHITLSMMAHAWLASVRRGAGEKPGPGTGRVERPRGAAAPGDRLAPSRSLSSPATGLVSLAPSQTTTGSSQSLSAKGRSLARTGHP